MKFGLNVHKILQYNLHVCFSFHVGLFFINFSSFKQDTENNANFDAVSSERANFEEVQFFQTYT